MSPKIRLVEMFWTYQGEGMNWGRRAFFVRMPFCNLQCSWCDTEFNKFERFDVEQIREAALMERSDFAVITGGEPMMNKQTPQVVSILKELGFEIATETNGCFPIVDGIDFVTISPKRDADYQINCEAALRADEVKVVVDTGFDFGVLKYIEDLVDRGRLNPDARLSLSPEFNNMATNLEAITEYLKRNPRWRTTLQTHKWIGVR